MMMRKNDQWGPKPWVMATNLRGEWMGEGPDMEKARREIERSERREGVYPVTTTKKGSKGRTKGLRPREKPRRRIG